MAHLPSVRAQGRGCASGAEQLHREVPPFRLSQACELARELSQPDGHLGAERGGDRLLAVGPTRHEGVAMRCRQPGEPVTERDRKTVEALERRAQLERLPVSMMSCVVAPQWSQAPTSGRAPACTAARSPTMG